MAVKLNKENAMLSILRYALNLKILMPVCYAIFESIICHASLVCT